MRILIVIESKRLDDADWGGGKGLVWEIKEEISKYADIDVEYVRQNKSKWGRMFYQYGGYLLRNICVKCQKYDKIIVFPGYLFWSIPYGLWNKTIVLGPDSMILNAFSLYRVTESFFGKNILRRICICLSKLNENLILHFCKRYIVVGNNDKKCINRLFPEYAKKVTFMHHPLLSKEQQDIFSFKYNKNMENKRFVFAGDLVKKYQEINVKKLVKALKARMKECSKDINVLVVGKNNYWVCDSFIGIPKVNVKYIDFVEDYFDVCRSGIDVHCIPLASGSGTKNRTLTAIANGLEIITTSIGIENIRWRGLTNVYIRSNMNDFADTMIKINNNIMTAYDYEKMVRKRIEFLRMMDKIKMREIKGIIEG
jgi:hypothetical protein